MKKFGARIRGFRTKIGMTQAELADALGVRYQTVSKWELGITFPDIGLLPTLADQFHVSLDELFGRNRCSGYAGLEEDDKTFLLKTYSQMYAPEAGPWNVSVANRYLEYRFADFFEKHFRVGQGQNICNIGIGAGEWDRYLSYQLNGGILTSVDQLEVACHQLEKRLIAERNPNPVEVVCSDVMDWKPNNQFDVVTMVGSTVRESKIGLDILKRAMDLVKPGGALYYQTLDENEDMGLTMQTAMRKGVKPEAFEKDCAYGMVGHYYKFRK